MPYTKAIMLILLCVLLGSVNQTVQAGHQPHYSSSFTPSTTTLSTTDNYDRYEKIDGTWYGIIEVTDSELISTNRSVNYNIIYLNFSRDTENLTSISYNYDYGGYCPTLTALSFGTWCLIGDYLEEDTGHETVYQEETVDMTFSNWITFQTSTANILKLPEGDKWDYLIRSEESLPFNKINIIEFTYRLTEAEVSAINDDIQAQYDNDLAGIMNDTTLSYAQKEHKVSELNLAYEGMELVYGQELHSYCLNAEHCIVESSNPPMQAGSSNLIFYGVIIVVALGILMAIPSLINDVAHGITAGVLTVSQTIAVFIRHYIWHPLYRGLQIIARLLFTTIFWWTRR